MKRLAPLCLVPLLACSSPAVPDNEPSTPWPASEWARSSPAEQGMDEGKLEALDRDLANGKYGYVDGWLVIRNGYLLFERSYDHDYAALFPADQTPGQYNYMDPSWHPFYRESSLHTMQSVSKSVTATLFGVAIQRGEFANLDEPSSPFFGEFELKDPDGWKASTVRDLLTMQSGIEWDESTVPYTDPANSCALMEASENWVQFVLDRPLAAEPGEEFVYNSGVTVLLAQILRESTGLHAHEYARTNLFEPLGIEDFYWKVTPTGVTDAEGGLYLKPHDLARIGYLYLNDGMWTGKRILPEGWVADATKPHVRFEGAPQGGFGYGYQWWISPHPRLDGELVFAGRGYGGQFLLVVPQNQLIGVFTGWNIYGGPSLSWQVALERLVEAIQ